MNAIDIIKIVPYLIFKLYFYCSSFINIIYKIHISWSILPLFYFGGESGCQRNYYINININSELWISISLNSNTSAQQCCSLLNILNLINIIHLKFHLASKNKSTPNITQIHTFHNIKTPNNNNIDPVQSVNIKIIS